MATFNRKVQLSSYLIDKNVLLAIENFCTTDLFEICNISKEDILKNKSQFLITFHNSVEYESYPTINDYKNSIFRDDVKSVEITQFFSLEKCELNITINFDKEMDKSIVTITLKSEVKREQIVSIESKLIEILNDYKTNNKLWHYINNIGTLIFIPALFGIIFFLNTEYSNTTRNIWLLVSIISIFLIITPNHFKPYSTFDSHKQKQLDKWFTWFINGIMTFVIFNTVLLLLRKNIFGF